jgi:hypothetical protein
MLQILLTLDVYHVQSVINCITQKQNIPKPLNIQNTRDYSNKREERIIPEQRQLIHECKLGHT